MRNLNIIKVVGVLCIALCAFASCNDWLDLNPRSQEKADKLFSTEDGFKEVLAGCYLGLSKPEAYGREMTFGMVSVLGQEYMEGKGPSFKQSGNAYYDLNKFTYTGTAALGMIDKAWSALYNVIAQANTLLDYTERKKSVLSDLNYAVIRGESYAIRAFAHAELFRMFSDVVKMDPDKEKLSLPYVNSVKPGIFPQVTNEKFYELVMDDIDNALKLLEQDPIYTGAELSGSNAEYYHDRALSLNYYAVLGLKARTCMFWGDKSGALEAARTVIEAQQQKGLFPWVEGSAANAPSSQNRDRLFHTEHLFALNIMKLEDYIKMYFTNPGTDGPLMSKVMPDAMYDGEDYRRIFFETYSGNSDTPSKFWQLADRSSAYASLRDRMPVIRISEMYYIASECLVGVDNALALNHLNTVRVNRGIIPLTLDGSTPELFLMEGIKAEYQREFFAEGQLFFYNKRTTTSGTAKNDYVLPLPVEEWELGDRELIKK